MLFNKHDPQLPERGRAEQTGRIYELKKCKSNDIALNRSLGKVSNLGGLCYLPLPVGQSEHVYLNLPESTAVASFLPKAGFQYHTKESHGYLFSKFKCKPEVPQRKNIR